MQKLAKLWRQLKYSEETVYVYSELKKKSKAKEAMRLHEAKIIAQVSIAILIGQVIMLWITGVI
jgi:hypothetical protein